MNKFVKRGCTVLLALTLALGMSVSAFAAGEPTGEPMVKKDYQLTNAGTTSPDETFTFEVNAKSVTEAFDKDGNVLGVDDMPALSIASADYAEGGAGSENAVQNLAISHKDPFPNVGVYTYDVTEKAGNTAGVTYNITTMQLDVVVTHGEGDELVERYNFYPDATNADKGDTIVNKYSAGSLIVEKQVTGKFADKNKSFNFSVTFNITGDKTVNSTITYSNGTKSITPEAMADGSETVYFSLKDGERMEFKNVPYGVTYTVSEDDYTGQGYDEPKYDANQNGTIEAATVCTTVINNHSAEVNTGVILHSAPYVLLLVGVGAAAVAFLILKKHREV